MIRISRQFMVSVAAIGFISSIFLLSFFSPALGQDQPQITSPSYTAVLTRDLDQKRPAKEFNCLHKVYVYFTWYGLKGMHKVTALWFNPQGKQQDQVDLKFLADKPKVENWVALQFRNVLNEKYPLVPDVTSAKLIGKWEVKILLDGNLLERLDFFVGCG